jgi:hypothetical protein
MVFVSLLSSDSGLWTAEIVCCFDNSQMKGYKHISFLKRSLRLGPYFYAFLSGVDYKLWLRIQSVLY